MLRLMRLEVKCNNIKTYVLTTIIIALSLLGLLYLLVATPYIEPEAPKTEMITSYNMFIIFVGLIESIVFAIFSAVIYTRFVINDYKGGRALVLLSYPVPRAKILAAKIAVVVVITFLALIFTNVFLFMVFGGSEIFLHLIEDSFSFSLILQVIAMTMLTAFLASSMGVIAVAIGFIKKSIPTTIVTPIILFIPFSQILQVVGYEDIIPFLIFMLITVTISFYCTLTMSNKINTMEV